MREILLGSATALSNLLMMYFNMNPSVQMNDVQAVELLRLAAEKEVAAAKDKLREVYSACESQVYDLPLGIYHSAITLRTEDVKKGFNELASVRPNLFQSLIESESWAKVEPLLNREHAKQFHPDYKWFWAQPAPGSERKNQLCEIEMVSLKPFPS